MVLTEDRLLWLARMIGLTGFALLVWSGISGVIMASKTAGVLLRRFPKAGAWLKGTRLLSRHRLISLVGAGLFLLHPLPMLFAHRTTGNLRLSQVLIPFTAQKQTLVTGLGTLAFWTLLIVTLMAIPLKKLPRPTWRAFHYGVYLFLVLGLAHGLLISGEYRIEKELIDFEEPEKIVLLALGAVALGFPLWRVWATRRKPPSITRKGLAVLIAPFFVMAAAHAQGGSSNPAGAAPASREASNNTTQLQDGQQATDEIATHFFTGSYQTTLNFSLLGRPRPSLGHRLNLSHALNKGSIDTRLEYYIDGSYNADLPGVLQNNINEPKFEGQVMYNRPLTSRLGFTGGLLYHDNFKFPDRYYWAITGLTHTLPICKDVTLSSAALIEKKLDGARFFYDLSGTLEYRFAPRWNTQLALHRYENVGQFDPKPTQKGEVEIGLNRALSGKNSVGISFFRHVQYNAPNDQFSFFKVKYSVLF